MFSTPVRSWPLVALAALAVLLLIPAGAHAQKTPPAKTIIKDGPTGRYLMNGTWLFRADPKRRGVRRGFHRSGSRRGWRRVRVPNAWNRGSLSDASMRGSTVWYRRDFRVPRAAASDWIVRFESVRYRARVWLNGRYLGKHGGPYVPFELRLRGLRRGRTNRLVVQVNNRIREDDLPPGKVTTVGSPSGGWWNWGGILREVYIRRVRGIDISHAQVLPRVACGSCTASILYRVRVRNYRRGTRRIRVTTRFGGRRATIGAATVRGGSSKVVSGRVRIRRPRLWSPSNPYLYRVSITASGGGRAVWSLRSGVRQWTVRGGRLLLNGSPVNFRGGFMHEDDPVTGGAVTPARLRLFLRLTRELGGTTLRTHYPLHPYLLEQADRRGLVVWSEIPMFQVPTKTLRDTQVRRKALRMLRENILAQGNHASVMTWSVGNELTRLPGLYEGTYFKRSARLARRLDPTRPVSYASTSYPKIPCQKEFKPFDLLGFNTYFGWYPGPSGSVADRTRLGPYLARTRRCYPNQAIAVTEFGAEANRDGPPEDRGTYQFQARINDYMLREFARKRWLSGAIGMLIEFRVRPDWAGGNPFPQSPIHQKGVFDFRGNPKPAAGVLQRWFRSTQQFGLPPGT